MEEFHPLERPSRALYFREMSIRFFLFEPGISSHPEIEKEKEGSKSERLRVAIEFGKIELLIDSDGKKIARIEVSAIPNPDVFYGKRTARRRLRSVIWKNALDWSKALEFSGSRCQIETWGK